MSLLQIGRRTIAALALSAIVLACSTGDGSGDLATATTVAGADVSTSALDATVQGTTAERDDSSASAATIVPTTESESVSGSTTSDTTASTSGTATPETTTSEVPESETITSEASTSQAAETTAAPTSTQAPTTSSTEPATADALTSSTDAPTTATSAPATSAPATTAPATSTTASTAPATTAAPTTAAPTTAAPTTAAPTTSTSIATVRTPTSVVAGSSAAPTSAISLAAELTRAEQAIRNPAVDDAEAAAWGRRQQRLYRELSRNSEWAPTVIELVASDVRNAVELNWGARSNLNTLGKNYPIQDTLPAWRIKEPAPASDLTGFYREGEGNTGVSWTILAAINLVETRMGRIEGVSTAGAMGPMQFLPTTWNECCEGDPTDPHDAIIGAAHYLTVRGAPGNLDRAIFGYNNSNNYVIAVKNYAAVMAEDPLAYRGYYAWEVYYRSSAGLVRLPIGYEELEKVDAAAWLDANPTSRISD